MKRVIILALVLVATATGAVSTVSAQAQNGTTTGDGPESAVIQIDRHVTVTDYRYSDGTMFVTVRADLPTLIAVSGVFGAVTDAGAREVPRKQVMAQQGTTTISMDVEQYRGGAAVSVATSESAVYLSTGIQAVNPWEGGSATVGWFGGAGLSIGMFVLAALWVRRNEGGEPEVAGS